MDDLREVVAAYVHFEADFVFGVECADEQGGDVLRFFAFPRIVIGMLVGDESGRGFKHGVYDAQVVGTQRRSGFGEFGDGIDEAGYADFGFGGSPGVFDFGGYAVVFEVVARGCDEFGGDALALQVLYGLDVRVFGDCDDPACGLRCGFAVGKFGDFDDVGFVFADPVDAGEANVEDAAFDVVRDFLGTQK